VAAIFYILQLDFGDGDWPRLDFFLVAIIFFDAIFCYFCVDVDYVDWWILFLVYFIFCTISPCHAPSCIASLAC
jgi:hypothetical protein